METNDNPNNTETETTDVPEAQVVEAAELPKHGLHEVSKPTANPPDMFPDLNRRDTYYMVTAEWIEVVEPSTILAPGEQPKPMQLIPRKDNFFINIHPATFYLQNRSNFPMFVVTNSLIITKKVYDQTRYVMNAAQRAAEAEAAAQQQAPPPEGGDNGQSEIIPEKPDIKLVTE